MNSGDTAWVLTATALVLLMTIPGTAFLRRSGAPEKCIIYSDAVPDYFLRHQSAMGVIWLFAFLRT